jgi:hypothetical protein
MVRNKRHRFTNSSHSFWSLKSHACAPVSINILICIISPFFRNRMGIKKGSPFNIKCKFTISAARFDIVSTSPEKEICFRLRFFPTRSPKMHPNQRVRRQWAGWYQWWVLKGIKGRSVPYFRRCNTYSHQKSIEASLWQELLNAGNLVSTAEQWVQEIV